MFGKLLRRFVPFKEIGWKPIGEVFYRYQLVKTRWFNIYLHELTAPQWHEKCHDHPWWFVTLILWPGYLEENVQGFFYREPGTVWYRPAHYRHNVVTPQGTSWSIIVTGPKSRDWGFGDCHD